MTKPEPIASNSAVARKKILVVDDHPLMREGLRGTINREPDMMVCGEAANAHQAVEVFQRLAPDMVLLDITLPGKAGWNWSKISRRSTPAW